MVRQAGPIPQTVRIRFAGGGLGRWVTPPCGTSRVRRRFTQQTCGRNATVGPSEPGAAISIQVNRAAVTPGLQIPTLQIPAPRNPAQKNPARGAAPTIAARTAVTNGQVMIAPVLNGHVVIGQGPVGSRPRSATANALLDARRSALVRPLRAAPGRPHAARHVGGLRPPADSVVARAGGSCSSRCWWSSPSW